jgi:hypothetical protein
MPYAVPIRIAQITKMQVDSLSRNPRSQGDSKNLGTYGPGHEATTTASSSGPAKSSPSFRR